MSGYESGEFGDLEITTGQSTMDPELRQKITDMAESGHNPDEIIEAVGEDNLALALQNNSYLQDLLFSEHESDHAA